MKAISKDLHLAQAPDSAVITDTDRFLLPSLCVINSNPSSSFHDCKPAGNAALAEPQPPTGW